MAGATTRRALFDRFRGGPAQIRPPWAREEVVFTDGCRGIARCGACAEVCPRAIIAAGHAGYPIVDFARGACTFCGACADACPESCFEKPPRARAWSLTASVSDACVERKGVSCRMCADVCETGAIRFRPRLGGGATVAIERDACTGCGACLAPCPVKAISIAAPSSAGAIS